MREEIGFRVHYAMDGSRVPMFPLHPVIDVPVRRSVIVRKAGRKNVRKKTARMNPRREKMQA
jgi:hypothetical protein